MKRPKKIGEKLKKDLDNHIMAKKGGAAIMISIELLEMLKKIIHDEMGVVKNYWYIIEIMGKTFKITRSLTLWKQGIPIKINHALMK